MRELEFLPNDEGRARFEICFQALTLCPLNPEVSSWDDLVCALGALKNIGQESPISVKGVKLLDLSETGGIVTLTRSEYEFLRSRIKTPMWSAKAIPQVVETLTWLESLPQKDQGVKLAK